MSRASVNGAQRVVVKVGSSSLTTEAGGIDPDRVRHLVETLAGVRRRGADLVLVSSGAIAAGLSPLAFKRRPRDLEQDAAEYRHRRTGRQGLGHPGDGIGEVVTGDTELHREDLHGRESCGETGKNGQYG